MAGQKPNPKRRPSSRPPGSGAKRPDKITRAERLAAAERARKRQAQRTKLLVGAVLVALAVTVTVTVGASRRGVSAAVRSIEKSGACSVDQETDADSGTGRNHVDGPVTYGENPPSGGNHSPSPSPAGDFPAERAPADNQVVHSLEHGYVAIWYKPDLPAADLDGLRGVYSRNRSDVLLIPREALPGPVAATAWHQRVLCDQLDTESVETFVKFFANKGPEKVPH